MSVGRYMSVRCVLYAILTSPSASIPPMQLVKKAMDEEVHHPCNNLAPPPPPASSTPVAPMKKFTAGLNRFKNAAKAVQGAVKLGGEAAQLVAGEIVDKRFNIGSKSNKYKPSSVKKIGSMSDAASLLSMATKGTIAHTSQIFSPSNSLRKFSGKALEDSDDSDGDRSIHNGEYTDDDEGSSDEEDEKEYIGFRKNAAGANMPTYEGFGLVRGVHKGGNDDYNMHATGGTIASSSANTQSGMENNFDSGSASSSEEENEEDDFFGDSDVQSPHALTAFLEDNAVKLGMPSSVIKDASHLQNHVIVCGCESNLHMFIGELRRPCVVGETYHPILVVQSERPVCWNFIEETYNDVFLMEGNPTRPSVLKKMALKQAFSISLTGARTSMNRVDEQVVNTGTLFTFLKMERFLPQSLFATVELASSANMAVLNATIMRRFRESVQRQKDNRSTLVVNAKTHKSLTSNTLEHGSHVGKGHGHKKPSMGHKDEGKGRRSAALFNTDGRFATKRPTIVGGTVTPNLRRTGINSSAAVQNKSALPELSKGASSLRRGSVMGNAMHNLSSSINSMIDEAMDNDLFKVFESPIEELWDAMDTHHVLPVFASAKAFVPGSFEALVVQSYYVKLTPVICEKFVCGQFGQTLCSLPVPKELIGRRFMDLFRLFIANQVVCMGLYRAPQIKLGATLPYVYISPPTGTILAAGDRVYVFADGPNLQRSKIALNMSAKWTRGH